MNDQCQPRLLVISNVKPFPGDSGQQVRVRNSLIALQELFDITFLTVAKATEVESVEQRLSEFANHAIVLPSRIHRGLLSRLAYWLIGSMYAWWTGLKRSNYYLGRVELSPDRIADVCDPSGYELVLFEYWHTVDSVAIFRKERVPCVLDMHDLLWQSRDKQLRVHRNPLIRLRRSQALAAYRAREEAAWEEYDALIAISAGEADHVKLVAPQKRVLLAPMGVDTEEWPFCSTPAEEARIAYYGALGNLQNQRDAMRCYEKIMPLVWDSHPETRLWLVGSNPPPVILGLARRDSRVVVTGFVERVQPVIEKMTAVLCPFVGTFGFRSRLIEVMSLGVPVVATPDAAYGMGLEDGRGVFLVGSDVGMANRVQRLIDNENWAGEQRQAARRQVEENFSFEATYGHLAHELANLASGLA